MSAAITVEGLSKQYRIGHANQETMLRERLVNLMKAMVFRAKRNDEIISALRDVSFTIQAGEIVGFIGRNGAGKSTLLKVLSRITYPSSGTVKVNGKVASLLEVGTGFHEELTGRENVYLNGSILGMPRKEVDRKLDAIVEFSGVEKFIDTPIKRYSSGMRLRLGFAVAAHLDPDILIVDEVLAVGDAPFQKKCLAAMGDLRGGRTVLFVSHNLAAVEHLCDRCIWIDNGEIRMDGDPRPVIGAYLDAMNGGDDPESSESEWDRSRRGTGDGRYRAVELLSPEGFPQSCVRAGDPVVMRFHYSVARPIEYPSFGFRMFTDAGILVTDTSLWHHGIDIELLEAGDGYLDLEIDSLNLLPAKYTLSLWLTGVNGVVLDNVEQAVTINVEVANIYGSGKPIDGEHGIVFFPQRWNLSGMPRRQELAAGGLTAQSQSLVL
jgi:lipopolysaccharide transport system ATP-binding protein